MDEESFVVSSQISSGFSCLHSLSSSFSLNEKRRFVEDSPLERRKCGIFRGGAAAASGIKMFQWFSYPERGVPVFLERKNLLKNSHNRYHYV